MEVIKDDIDLGKPKEGYVRVDVLEGSEIIPPASKMKEVEINGVKTFAADIILHRTASKLGLFDIIKLFCGAKLHSDSVIYTKHSHCLVVGSVASVYASFGESNKNKLISDIKADKL